MLIALANPAGDFTATLFMPLAGQNDSFEATASEAAVGELFERHFGDVTSLVDDLAGQFLANPTGRLSTIRTSGWGLDDRALLVGDAAHAIVPFHGQGMNLAMESCRLLARQIARHPGEMAKAFATFEAERKPDADAIAEMALDNYVEMRAGVVDPAYLLRRQLALELERRHPDRVAPRYGMVMFTTMPYAAVKRRASQQQAMLAELTAGVTGIDEVDYSRAAELADALGPLPEWL
jgi:kynurenine 3-monooxygenase